MSNTAWLIVALIVVAAGIGGYTASVVTRRRAFERRLDADEVRSRD